MHRRTPNQLVSGHRKTAPVFAAVILAAAGCAASAKEAPHTANSASEDISHSSAAASSESASAVSAGVATEALVCDALVAQHQPNGKWRLYGRPAVSGNSPDYHLEEVKANSSGVQVTPLPEQNGAQQWYDMYGDPIPGGAVAAHCAEQSLHSVHLSRPDSWVATTNQGAALPQFWDSRALNPAGFGGAGLDYGEMDWFNVAGVTDQAQEWQRQAQHHS